jgi:hypothetical protein
MKKIAITALVGEFDHFADEANQMTLSGKDLDDKFHFVLFVEPESVNKIKIRKNVSVYEYKSPQDDYYNKNRFAKSLVFVNENKKILENYDYIIKTDTDVFFTPHMNSHIFDDKIYFGFGHHKWSHEQMFEVAHAFGYYDYKDVISPNSTLIGTSKDIIEIMKESDDLCKKVFYYLCPDGEFQNQIDHWGKQLYAGTSTLIATEIVLASKYTIDKFVMTNKIDGDSTSKENYNNVYHMHQWHTDNIFSKFKARNGEYDSIEYREDSSCSSYCLNIFLQNKKEINV